MNKKILFFIAFIVLMSMTIISCGGGSGSNNAHK